MRYLAARVEHAEAEWEAVGVLLSHAEPVSGWLQDARRGIPISAETAFEES
jgi:hypothetical protein